MKQLMSSALVCVLVSGCAQNPGLTDSRMSSSEQASCSVFGPKSKTAAVVGAATGAGIGALAGRDNRLAGAAIGAGIGLLLGALAGKSLDNADCQKAVAALRQMDTAKTGEAISWTNPDTGNSGTFVPLADASQASGKLCRPYKRTMTLQDGTTTGGDNGVVCRDANGDWSAVS